MGITDPTQPTAAQEAAIEPVAVTPPDPDPDPDGLVLEELLVEDVSIDGMCGVY